VGDEQLSFDRDIKPLFREQDQTEMSWAFDLWSHGDVRDNADAILERLETGDMPCDDSWPEDRVALFRRWAEAGAPA